MKKLSIGNSIMGQIFIALTMCFLFLGFGSYSWGEEKGLIAFWNFDGGGGSITEDVSGNSNHGRIHGAKWVKCDFGYALKLDGIDDYIDCGENITRNIKNSSYTVGFWVKPALTTGSHCMMSFENMRIELQRGKVIFMQGCPSLDKGYRIAGGQLLPNQWYHIAGVFNKDKSLKLYINGILQPASTTKAHTPAMITGTICIGTVPKANSRFFAGIIDEVRIYEKALSKEEINNDCSVRFGVSADPHLPGRTMPPREDLLEDYVDAMMKWKPDFVIDLGDFAVQCGAPGFGKVPTTREKHDGQLKGLIHHTSVLSRLPCPYYLVIGNHDMGFFEGGDEKITPEDLYKSTHHAEDITKDEVVAHTRILHRYYSFDIKRYHFIVLDGNNKRPPGVPAGKDGGGWYWIDDTQKAWLKEDLAANREKIKLVFCHEELHCMPPESVEGEYVPPSLTNAGFIHNGWELREMFTADGKVLACFFGHKHCNKQLVLGGVNYITFAAMFWWGNYAKVTISDKLYIEGFRSKKVSLEEVKKSCPEVYWKTAIFQYRNPQRSYVIPTTCDK
ncbi:metallophosphoesterase [bacterium]|nr:metallophosphoesterase [bacterium]